jgi:hypothetical protein
MAPVWVGYFTDIKKDVRAGCWWLTPVILAAQEADIRRIEVRSQPGQVVLETLSQKPHHQEELAVWLKVKALSSNPSPTKKKDARYLHINPEGRIY